MVAQPLSPAEVLRRLADAGMPLAPTVLATDVADVAAAFREIGSREVVVKAAGLLHKTEAGAIVMGLASEEDAEDAARSLAERLPASALPLLVQEQVNGLEFLVGIRRDAKLGTAVVAGLGGVLAELHRDVAYGLLPVTRNDALSILQRLRSWPLLDGFRGAAKRDVDALCDVMVRVGAMAIEDPSITELDFNPVIVGRIGEGCAVVDARIVTVASATRPARRTPDLARMLHPKHIAVVGVSDDATKVGARLFRYLADHGFDGRLSPIHPSGGQVFGTKRYEALSAVEGTPDLVCVAVPAAAVPDVARQAVEVGAGGVLVHSSDFAEAGGAGIALQEEVRATLDEAGIPLLGPNSMGFVAPSSRTTASISAGLESMPLIPGGTGLLTSSGGLGSCIATRLAGAGVGLSHWIHVGNEADLTLADLLGWFADDPETATVGLLVEDIKDGPRLIEAGQRMIAAGKTMFAYNMVRTDEGRSAALSHTGAMVGSIELREEVLRAAGMVSVPTLRVLEDALLLCSVHELPRGPKLVAVTFSGGASTIIADEAQRVGMQLPPLSDAMRERVRAWMPSYAAIRNPLDSSYQMLSDPDGFMRAMTELLSDGEFDAALVQFTTNADPFASETAHAVVTVANSTDQPIYVSRFGSEQLAPKAMRIYEEAGIPVLDAPDRAVQAIAAVMQATAIGRSGENAG